MEKNVFEVVKHFMDACGQKPSEEVAQLYAALIEEEFKELEESRDAVEMFDAILDLIWVLIGLAHSLEYPIEEGWKEVARSNYTKIGPDGKVYKDVNGKVIKPEYYSPPNLEKILNGTPSTTN